jgi:hypothetical protein
MAAQTLVITDNTSHVTFESSATNEQRQHFPKNGIILRREGNKFLLMNGGDNTRELLRIDYSTDTLTIGGSTPASADAFETTLKGYLFQ